MSSGTATIASTATSAAAIVRHFPRRRPSIGESASPPIDHHSGATRRFRSDSTLADIEQRWDRGADAGRRLDGRVAIVTGAGTAGGLLGIGEAIAILFAAQGADVGIVDISAERAERTRSLVEDVGGESVVTVGDLTKVDQNERCVAEVVERFGGLDIVVNSAAVTGGGGSPVDVDLREWDDAMGVNLTAIVLTAG